MVKQNKKLIYEYYHNIILYKLTHSTANKNLNNKNKNKYRRFIKNKYYFNSNIINNGSISSKSHNLDIKVHTNNGLNKNNENHLTEQIGFNSISLFSFNINNISVFGLGTFQSVSLDDDNYLMLAEKSNGCLTVKQSKRTTKLKFHSYEDETDIRDLGDNFLKALDTFVATE